MGLAIVRKTVSTVGGTISIESTPPQRGTRFRFTWPKVISPNNIQEYLPPKGTSAEQ